jgi:hypothetical protein
MENLICFECGSEYRMVEKPPSPDSGSFRCPVCGETIFCWQADRTDYDFVLTQRGGILSPS